MSRLLLTFTFIFLVQAFPPPPSQAAEMPATLPVEAAPSPVALAQEALPLYELGLGIGATYFPHYPGSDQSKLFVMPFPFAIVRGKVLQSDRRGMRARLFTGRSFDISVSGAGAFPVKSGENRAREGMSELGWIGQGGPKLRVELAEFPDGGLLRLGFSVRVVVASKKIFELDHRGAVYEPEIVYVRPNTFMDRFDLYASLRSAFASRGVMSYFYHVAESEVTSTRQAYNAKAGYLESIGTVGLSLRSKNNRHRWFVSTDLEVLEGATNLGSPLVKTRVNSAVALAWIWTFLDSKEKATVVY